MDPGLIKILVKILPFKISNFFFASNSNKAILFVYEIKQMVFLKQHFTNLIFCIMCIAGVKQYCNGKFMVIDSFGGRVLLH